MLRRKRGDRCCVAPIILTACIVCAGFLLSGCGTPAAPQPPSLKLPEPVSNLTAVRAGNDVTLHWTMPRKTTDHLLIQGPVTASICRRESAAQACTPVGHASDSPRAETEFHDPLPAALSQGSPRELVYFVELLSPKGKSAGPSNAAIVLAGQAPGPISGLSAQVRANGVAFHWENGDEADHLTDVRLHRKLLTVSKVKERPQSGITQTEQEPVLRDLLSPPPDPGQQTGALDTSAHFGESYEYTAQRVVQVTLDAQNGKQTFELDGPVSVPIKVDVIDTFPPAIPQELVAVYVPEQHAIDLSWQPDTEPDLAGYIVYRSTGDSDWVRISGSAPVIGPAYRDLTAEKGHIYSYAVSAIDLIGHESKRSAEAKESTPAE